MELDVDAGLEICERATAGEWEFRKFDGNLYAGQRAQCVGHVAHDADGEFFAYARTALPEALSRLKRLREIMEYYSPCPGDGSALIYFNDLAEIWSLLSLPVKGER